MTVTLSAIDKRSMDFVTGERVTRDNCETAKWFLFRDDRGKITRWKRNGKTVTWATRPDDFRIPVKFGLYDFGYITHLNAYFFRVEG